MRGEGLLAPGLCGETMSLWGMANGEGAGVGFDWGLTSFCRSWF